MDSLVDKGEYLELKALYDGKLQEAQAAAARLREEMENLLQNRTGVYTGSGSSRSTRT